jgi:4-hydroxybenzoate polyprenyltransferase
MLVAATGMLASPGVAQLSVVDGARGIALAFLLSLVFRIWDDLEDRERDALLHPGRITGRIGAVRPLVALASSAAALAALLVLAGPQSMQRLLVLALLGGVLLLWYRARASTPIANAVVVLAKYPVIACVCAPASPLTVRDVAHATPFLLALYLFLCIHEALDDPILRRSFGRGSPT